METEEDKQNFLRENILNKNYDPNLFMQFLQEKKPGDIDINNWTISELQEAVNEFISTQSQPPEEYANDQQEQQQNDEQPPEMVQPPPKKEDPPKPSVPENLTDPLRPYPDTIKSEEIGKTKLSDLQEIIVAVSNPEKVEGSLFSKGYVSYLVETAPLGLKVRRRYSDFEWFRQVLSALYLGVVLPTLPRKNLGIKAKTNPNFITKRMNHIERFLNGVVNHPLLKNAEIIYEFLSIENEKEFNKKKDKYIKMKGPNKVTEIKSIEGEVEIKICKERETYFSNLKDDVINNHTLICKLTDAYKAYYSQLHELIDKIKNISDIWGQLARNSTKYFDDEIVINIYNTMKSIMDRWANSQKQEIELLKTGVKNYFSFIKKEFLSFKEFNSKVEDYKNNFYKTEEKLLSKKNELFKKQEFYKWELDTSQGKIDKNKLSTDRSYAFSKMLPKETSHLLELKEMYGYYLNMSIKEYERLRALNSMRHKDRIFAYCQDNADIITDLYVAHTDLAGVLVKCGAKLVPTGKTVKVVEVATRSKNNNKNEQQNKENEENNKNKESGENNEQPQQEQNPNNNDDNNQNDQGQNEYNENNNDNEDVGDNNGGYDNEE